MPAVQEISQPMKREDLSDKLVVADAKNTPFTSMMKKGKKPVNTLYHWPVGEIPDPDTDSVPDGQPAQSVENLGGNRQPLYARVHKLRRVFGVSEMAEDVSTPAGVESEFRHNKANALLAVKRGVEAVFCGTQDSSLVGTKHTCRGLFSWINNSAQAELPVPADYRTPAASIYSGALASLTEDDIRGVMKSIYNQTGSMGNWDGFFGTDAKEHVSKMTIHDPDVASKTVVRTFFAQLKDNTLTGIIDIIKGDFGTIRLHPTLWNAWNNTTKLPDAKYGSIVDMNDLEMRANKLPYYKPLPDDDSGPQGLVAAIVSFLLGNPLKHGAIKAT